MLRVKYIRIFLITILLAVTSLQVESGEKGVVIVKSEVSEKSLSTFQLLEIYDGNTQFWKNQAKITPCYLDPKDNELGMRFFKDLLNLSPVKFRKLWLKRVFSGQGSAPISLSNDKRVLEFVSDHRGAIGIISESWVDTTQNIRILVIDSSSNF